MELLFVTVIGAGIGAIVRYVLPHRVSYGIFLLPAVAAAITAVVWVALLWAGLTFDGGWIWVASLVAGGAAAILGALLLPRRRKTTDDRMLAHLSRA
jgi:hypothetical protein